MSHNLLYSQMPLDQTILEQYPNDDALPGVKNNIVEDHVSDVSHIFYEKTAGLSKHPAEILKETNSESNEPFILLEKVGVSVRS